METRYRVQTSHGHEDFASITDAARCYLAGLPCEIDERPTMGDIVNRIEGGAAHSVDGSRHVYRILVDGLAVYPFPTESVSVGSGAGDFVSVEGDAVMVWDIDGNAETVFTSATAGACERVAKVIGDAFDSWHR